MVYTTIRGNMFDFPNNLRISKDGSPYYIGIGMVPSIIDVWGYDREFCSSSSSSSSPSSSSSSSSSSSTNVTQKLK